MKTIWKYELDVLDEQKIEVPKEAEPLYVNTQNGNPCVWFKVDPEQEKETRTIRTFGTGHPIHHENINHIGSYLMSSDALVFHVFIDA